jgi:hypothetical protein
MDSQTAMEVQEPPIPVWKPQNLTQFASLDRCHDVPKARLGPGLLLCISSNVLWQIVDRLFLEVLLCHMVIQAKSCG